MFEPFGLSAGKLRQAAGEIRSKDQRGLTTGRARHGMFAESGRVTDRSTGSTGSVRASKRDGAVGGPIRCRQVSAVACYR